MCEYHKNISNHEFFLKFRLDAVFISMGPIFFLGIYLISNLAFGLLDVYILFFKISYFFSSFDDLLFCICCFFNVKFVVFSFSFSFNFLLSSEIVFFTVKDSIKLVCSSN